MTALPLCDGWRLTEDGEMRWILQRESPQARHERHRWSSRAFCGTRQSLLEVALPHHTGSQAEAAARLALARLTASREDSRCIAGIAPTLDRARGGVGGAGGTRSCFFPAALAKFSDQRELRHPIWSALEIRTLRVGLLAPSPWACLLKVSLLDNFRQRPEPS